MKLHFLRYFLVLAEELHFGRAAQKLTITQPPLSTAIKSLEDELGVALFVRDSKRVQLTQAGSAFLDEVRDLLDRLDRASHMAQMAASGVRGRLDVGVTGSLLYRGVPAMVHAFHGVMPEVKVELREMSTASQLDELMRGRLDIGFLNVATVPPPLRAVPLGPDEFVLCIPEDHPKAGHQSVDLKDFAQDPFVMFSREVAPANHDNVIALFSRAGIHPQTVHAARQWLTVIAMVAHGLGVSIVPKTLSQTRMHGVRFMPFKGAPAHSPASLVWNPEHHSSRTQCFVDQALRLIQGASD